MLLKAEFELGSGCFTALGAIGKRAERVADEAVDDLFEYLDSDGCIDKYLADQLLLPLAIIPGKSLFSTSKVTNHFLTNISVVKQFLNIQSEVQGQVGEHGIVKISGGLH
jgi:RNA 3'-terminal phosphate cyclase (ATP)